MTYTLYSFYFISLKICLILFSNCNEESRGMYIGYGGESQKERPRCRWVNNNKIDLREIGWDGMDWIDLAQDRDQWRAPVNTVIILWVQ
jgi:hypothetical protein